MTRGKNLLPIQNLNPEKIDFILCDIDDTLTNEGKLFSQSYDALWRLKNAGYKIVPITGRPAGWCEMIARLWPIDAIVGENGAFSFFYENKKMNRIFFQSESERKLNHKKLDSIAHQILSEVPGSALASDQFCRSVDLAIDFCEDIPALSKEDVEKIVGIFESRGAVAKVSSIHVNGWFGNHDKLSMTLRLLKEKWSLANSETIQESVLFIGDSPNDEPMFKYFKNSVGVKNVLEFKDSFSSLPYFLCQYEGGLGFTEMTDHILS